MVKGWCILAYHLGQTGAAEHAWRMWTVCKSVISSACFSENAPAMLILKRVFQVGAKSLQKRIEAPRKWVWVPSLRPKLNFPHYNAKFLALASILTFIKRWILNKYVVSSVWAEGLAPLTFSHPLTLAGKTLIISQEVFSFQELYVPTAFFICNN